MIFVGNLETILGLNVVTSDAHIIGQVKGAKLDTATWTVKFLEVKLTGDAAKSLGKKKRFGSSKICMPVNMIQAVGNVIALSKSIAELESSSEIVECKE